MDSPSLNDTLAYEYDDGEESSGGATLDLRIAAIFVILFAATLGGLPPLFISVNGFRRVRLLILP